MPSNILADIAVRRPVASFVALAFVLSWIPWLTLPTLADGHWGLIKVFIGCGLGPGLAAVILDRVHGTGAVIGNRAWWARFTAIAVPVAALCAASIHFGDALMPEDLPKALGRHLDAVAWLGIALCAAQAGFVFASAAGSQRESLNGIARMPSRKRWLWIGFLLPAAFVLLSLPLAPLLGEDPPALPWANLSWPVAVGYLARAYLFTLLVTCIGEEPGWRGWMLPMLQRNWSPLSSTVLVGVVWGLWHYPLFFNGAYPGSDPDKIVEYIFLGPLLGLGFTWMFNRTGLLLPCLLLHAGLNNWPRILPTGSLYPVLFSLFLLALIVSEKMWRRRAAARGPDLSDSGQRCSDASDR